MFYSNNKEITDEGGCRAACKHKTCVHVHKTLTLERFHKKDKLYIPFSVPIHLHAHTNTNLCKTISYKYDNASSHYIPGQNCTYEPSCLMWTALNIKTYTSTTPPPSHAHTHTFSLFIFPFVYSLKDWFCTHQRNGLQFFGQYTSWA